MKHIISFALAALMGFGALYAETDENGVTPTYWYKFDGSIGSSGAETFNFDGGVGTTYLDTYADKAYSYTSYPWCSGLNRGTGDFTIVTVARTADLANGVIWAMGRKTSTTGFALVSKGARQIALRVFGSTWDSAGKDILTVSVPDAATAFHVYTLVYSESARTCTLFVDGTSSGSAAWTLSACTETYAQFGSLHGTLGYSMVAGAGFALDDFRLYRQALTSAEVSAVTSTFIPPLSTATVSANTNWSAIVWQPVPAKPAFARLLLTVENNAKIAFDTTPAFASLTVNGTCTVDANGTSARDLASYAVAGAPYSHWIFRATGTITGTFVYDPDAAFPSSYATALESVDGFGLRLVITAPETARFGSISINFKESDAQSVGSSADTHGVFKVPGTAWNDVTAENTVTTLTRYTASDFTIWTDGTTALSVTQVKNSWRRGSAGDTILVGYLDDGSRPRLTLGGIPFTRYRVIAYRSTDTANAAFGAYRIGTSETDATFYFGAYAKSATVSHTLSSATAADWGSTSQLTTFAEGVNYVVSDVLSGGKAFIDSPAPVTSGSRVCVPAIQIVEVGQVVEESVDYTATLTAAGSQDLSTATWSPTPFNPTRKDRLILTIDPSVEGEVTLNLDAAALRVQQIAVVSAGSATLRLTGTHPADIEQWNFAQVRGKVSFDFAPNLAQIVPGAAPRIILNAPYTGEVRSGFEYRGTGNVLTLPATAQSGMDVVFGGSGTFTGTIVNKEFYDNSSIVWDGTYTHAGNASLSLTDGTLTLTPDASVTVPHLRLLNSNALDNEAHVTIAGTLEVDSTSDANCYAVRNNFQGILLGHWQGTNTLTVSGALVGTNTWLQALFTAASSTVTVDGGLLQVRGISCVDMGGHATIRVQNGGTLQLAEGLSEPEYATWSFDNGTLKAYAWGESNGFTFDPTDTTFTGACTIDPNGCAVSLPGAITGSGTLTVRDSSAGAQGAVTLEGDLSGFDGTIHIANGTYNFGSLREKPAKITFDAAVTFAATQTRAEYGSGERITLTGLPDGATVTLTRIDGTTEEATVADGAATFASTLPRIDGAACFFDVTFTNLWDMANSQNGFFTYKAVPGAVLKYDSVPTFANTNETEHALSERGVYIRHHPYIEGANEEMTALSTFTAVVVGQMSPSSKTTFIHLGSCRTGGHAGLLIATTEVKDEVVVARTYEDNVYPIKTLSVPNSSTARHVYIVSKYDVPATDAVASHSVFDVYLDGVKRATVPMDGLFTLGSAVHCGVQVGADFGGTIRNTGASRFVENVETEVGVINVLRFYDYALTADQVTLFTTQYPYVSAGGLFTRSFAGAATFNATATWTKTGSDTPADEPTGTGTYDPSATLTATESTSITVNTASKVETLTLNGEAFAFTRDGVSEHALDVTGATVVNTSVTVAYGAVNLGNAPVMLGARGALTFDLADLTLTNIYTTTDIQLTGLTDESDQIRIINLPTAPFRTAALVYAGGQYVLRVTPNHEAGARIFLPGGTVAYADDTLVKTAQDEDTVAFPGDILVMREAGTVRLNQTAGLLDHLELDATNATVRLLPGADGLLFNGEHLALLAGTLQLAGDSSPAPLGTATLTLGTNATLAAACDLALDDTLTLGTDGDQTIFASAGATPIALAGTGMLVKTGTGRLALGARLTGLHPLTISSGTLALTQSDTLGTLAGTGTLEIPTGVVLTASDAASCSAVTLTGDGTLKLAEAVVLNPDASGWTGLVELDGRYGATPTSVNLGAFSNLSRPVRITCIEGEQVWMTAYDLPSVELAGTLTFNDYNLDATYTYQTVSGAGEIRFLECTNKVGLAGATIAIQKFVGTNIACTATANQRIAIMTMQVDELPAVNHRLLASTTPDHVTVAAVQEGSGTAISIPLQIRADGLYVTLSEAEVVVRIGEDVYRTAQEAIDAVTASGRTLRQVDARIVEGAEIPHGYYRNAGGRLLPREPFVLLVR